LKALDYWKSRRVDIETEKEFKTARKQLTIQSDVDAFQSKLKKMKLM